MDMSSVSGGKSWLMAGAGRMSGDKRGVATFCLQEKDDFIREGKRNKIKKEDLYSLPFFGLVPRTGIEPVRFSRIEGF